MNESVVHLLQLLYFMAPAYLANMAPPFVRYWKGWNRPPLVSRPLSTPRCIVDALVLLPSPIWGEGTDRAGRR